jgi:RecJ-like exonuclease
LICENCRGKGRFWDCDLCTVCNGSGITSCCDTAGSAQEYGTWENSEFKLISDISVMFHDAMSVKCVPSDYAKAVIKMVRDHDREKES